MRPASRLLPQWTSTPLLAGLDLRAYSDRTMTPEQTVGRLWPHLETLGITRVARHTDLDRIGIPCWAAFRPNSRTLAGSQGKGVSDAAACASAIMEAAESAVAERPAGHLRIASALDLERHGERWHNPQRLMQGDFDRGAAIQWLCGRDLHTGEPAWVALDAIDMDGEQSELRGICKTTNGLASGNTTQEAVFHALCELVERDGTTLASLLPLDEAMERCIAPAALRDPLVDALVRQIESSGFELRLFDHTSDIGVPVIMAMVAPAERPLRHLDVAGGWGCHPVAARAAIRAITEAAQGRVTAIAASRDDIEQTEFDALADDEIVAQMAAPRRGSAPLGLPLHTSLADLTHFMLRALARRQCSVTALDISHPSLPFAVARLVSEDLEDRDANINWQPGARSRRILEEAA
jgi:ribosomal protein S12 methylthiotransferase accessory factor